MLKALVRAQQAAARLQTRERGATAVEYGLMIALIAAVIVGVVFALGGNLNNIFNTVNTKV
ncbi:Flp family type IVb pilin [Lapillicoccus jejuensis]|uniref:Pilus assembly protein Flp/PilA n=1 Tax=Lapillicoccus jejuensis TaxID=402171 RepID=A0A542E2I9_9MICO|nr:Flp family type IVb pilin [Lapillicoccus jejuensis]TQJ09546.1 pilus assembly protein Flp/PilA [Lapillicoccus jejuensis]